MGSNILPGSEELDPFRGRPCLCDRLCLAMALKRSEWGGGVSSRCTCLRDRRVFVRGNGCFGEAGADTSSTTWVVRGETRGTSSFLTGAGLGAAPVLRTVTATTGGNIDLGYLRSEAFERSDGLGSQFSSWGDCVIYNIPPSPFCDEG